MTGSFPSDREPGGADPGSSKMPGLRALWACLAAAVAFMPVTTSREERRR